MCILSVYRPNVPVSVDELTRGARCNSDGHGYAIIINGEILVGHSLRDPDALIAEFAALRAEHPNTHAIFHSRITTHGAISEDNCHPFFVAGDSRTVLAHNGVLPALVQPEKGDDRSDTRILAEDLFMNRWGKLDKAKTRDSFTKWITKYNKVVILTVDPRYKSNLYLFNESEGVTTAEGVWHSNSTFRGYSRTTYGTGWSWSFSAGTDGYGSGSRNTSARYRHDTADGAYLWDEVTEAWEYVPASDDDSRYKAWWEDAEEDGCATAYTRPVVIGLAGKFTKAICPSCRTVDCVSKVDLICNGCHQCFVCYEEIRDCDCSYVLTGKIRQRLQALDDAAPNLSIDSLIRARNAIREYTDDMAYEAFCERNGTLPEDRPADLSEEDIMDASTFREAIRAVRETLALPAAPVVTVQTVLDEMRREAA